MRCIHCDELNKEDALYCQRCGKGIKKCATCNVFSEGDALFCRRCGASLKTSHEGPAGAPEYVAQGAAAPPPPNFGDDSDYATKASPKRQPQRVVSLKASGPRRWARAALYGVSALLLAGVIVVLVTTWRSVQTLQPRLDGRLETLSADFQEFKRLIAETRDEDRQATYKEIAKAIAQNREEERKATSEEIKKVVAKSREEDRKVFSDEIEKAVAMTKAEDYKVIVAELTKLKAKTRNSGFRADIDRVIWIFSSQGRIPGNAQGQNAGSKSRRVPGRRDNLTE